MKKISLLISLLLISNMFAYDITTGGSSGTYIKFGKQIKKYVADKSDIEMSVLTSRGSVDNINKMTVNENIRFAIVQHDVINDFRNSGDNEFKMLVRNIKVLLPLYYEEIHFIARKDSSMRYIKDIKNKKINAGKKGSGTLMTTTMLYKELFNISISSNNKFYDGSDTAFENLKNGRVDVVVIVSGQPSGTIEKLNGNDFKLLQRHPNTTSSIYYHENINIKRSSYSWLNQTIPTFAVKAYLVTYDNSSKTFENNMRKFAKQFRNSMSTLRHNSKFLETNMNKTHDKWNRVNENLEEDSLQSGWKFYEPFRDAWRYAKCTEDERLMGLCK